MDGKGLHVVGADGVDDVDQQVYTVYHLCRASPFVVELCVSNELRIQDLVAEGYFW